MRRHPSGRGSRDADHHGEGEDELPHAAAQELRPAVLREHNAFKVELAKRAIVRGLTQAMGGGAR